MPSPLKRNFRDETRAKNAAMPTMKLYSRMAGVCASPFVNAAEARQLVERGEGADVAPQPGRKQENRRHDRDDELPEHEETRSADAR